MSVTNEDRERAAELYLGCRKTAYHRQEATVAIAEALAAERERVRAPFLALADELDHEAGERNRIADRLPNQPAYHMEINRLVVAAEHQRRSAKQIRRRAAEDS